MTCSKELTALDIAQLQRQYGGEVLNIEEIEGKLYIGMGPPDVGVTSLTKITSLNDVWDSLHPGDTKLG